MMHDRAGRAVQPSMRRALWLTPLLVTACGGALPGLPAPGGNAGPTSTSQSPGYASIEDAQRDLDRAEREVAMFGPRNEKQKDTYASPPPPPPTQGQPTPGTAGAPPPPTSPPAGAKPADAAPKAPQKREAPRADDARAESKKADEERSTREPAPCETACRALTSMTRAADAICRMTGDADPRCTSARKRVDESASRVAQCRCE